MLAVRLISCTALAAVLLMSGCGRRQAEVGVGIDSLPCEKKIEEGLSACFDINPKPVKAMSEVLFSVVLKKGDSPVNGATINLDLSMPGMYMATNRISLSQKGEGVYEGRGAIVRCPSGRKVWRADISVELPGRKPSLAGFTFRVAK